MCKHVAIAIDGPSGAGKSTLARAVAAALPGAVVGLAYRDGEQRVFLGDEDVSEAIRTPEASRYASKVSAIPAVRDFLLETQRRMARENSVVLDGRDIGTVVLPDAGIKIFLHASAEERAQRRYKELIDRGTPQPYEDVLADLRERAERDENRAAAPLRRAEGAVDVDPTGNTLDESRALLIRTVRERL